VDGINNASGGTDPHSIFPRIYGSKSVPPNGFNYMLYQDPKLDALFDKAFTNFDEKQRDRILAHAHAHKMFAHG